MTNLGNEIDYFTVRSRALASFLTAIVGVIANMSTGALLDLPIAQSTKSRTVFVIIATAITACWVWNAVVQAELSNLVSAPIAFDIGQTGSAASAFAVYMSEWVLSFVKHASCSCLFPATITVGNMIRHAQPPF